MYGIHEVGTFKNDTVFTCILLYTEVDIFTRLEFLVDMLVESVKGLYTDVSGI